MKEHFKYLSITLMISLFMVVGKSFAQDITFEPQDTILSDTLGTAIIFYIDVTNVSQTDQTVFIVRTINDLPMDWTSSMCFDVCFADFVDSIATTPDFGSTPLTPGETREVSLHVFTWMNEGTANVQLQAGTFDHPDDRITVDFIATTIPTSVENDLNQPDGYFLSQNYPNPFNPSTKISYGIQEAGVVIIKVYNILGSEVVTLVNEHKPAGNYEVSFGEGGLASGVYIYRLTVNSFIQTRKMILEK